MKLSWEFDDVDHLRESVKDWDLEFLPLVKGLFGARISQYFFKNISLGLADFNSLLEQKGSTPQDSKTFVIPMETGVNYLWRNTEITDKTISLFPASRELYSISNESFSVCTISVNNSYILKVLSDYKLDNLIPELEKEQTWKVSSSEIMALQELVNQITKNYLIPEIVDIYIEDLVSRILIAFADRRTDRREEKSKKLNIVYECSNWIDSKESSKLNLKHFYHYSGFSRRTIETAFKTVLHTSPNSYLKKVRLKRVKNDLKDSSFSIGEIASLHGFEHQSQFSLDFKKEYGCLPSEYRKSLRLITSDSF